MDARIRKFAGRSIAAAGVIAVGLTASTLFADEPGRLGKFFGLGSNSKPANSSAKPAPAAPSPNFTSNYGTPGASSSSSSSPGTKLVAQPRSSHAATEADPLVTRISICRAEDGKQFCAFLQVFADGTVLDSDGIHKVGPDLLRPIAQLMQSGELARVKGFCGGASADYVEQVQTVVYDRYLGRLRAHSLAYSGNPGNCDASVRQLNTAVEAIQAKIMGPPVSTTPATGSAQPVNVSGARPITLTPIP